MWDYDEGVPDGGIHALALQLFVSGILDLQLSSPGKVGSDKLKVSDIMVSLAKVKLGTDDDKYDGLAIDDNSMWEGFNFL